MKLFILLKVIFGLCQADRLTNRIASEDNMKQGLEEASFTFY